MFLLQRDVDVDRKIQDFVVTEEGIICQLPQKKIDGVIVLLGCFYVFNVSYTPCKAILTFLDQALLESGLGQTPFNVSSFFLLTWQMSQVLANVNSGQPCEV